MIGTVRAIQRNVKNWSSCEMSPRWTAAGMLQAETRFRKFEGYRGLAQLAIHIETDLIKRRHQLQTELTPAVDVTISPGTVAESDFHDGRDILLVLWRSAGRCLRRVMGPALASPRVRASPLRVMVAKHPGASMSSFGTELTAPPSLRQPWPVSGSVRFRGSVRRVRGSAAGGIDRVS